MINYYNLFIVHPHVVVTSIFNDHHPLLSQSLCDPIGVAWSLYQACIIKRDVVTCVESASPSLPKQREVLLNAVNEAIMINPTGLQTFASILCTISTNLLLGQAILDDYSKYKPCSQINMICIPAMLLGNFFPACTCADHKIVLVPLRSILYVCG